MCVCVCMHTHECVLIQWIREIIVRNDYPLLRRGGGESGDCKTFPVPSTCLSHSFFRNDGSFSALWMERLCPESEIKFIKQIWGGSKRKVCISSKSGCIASKVAGITEITTKRSWSHPQVRRRETDCWERIDTPIDNHFSGHYYLIKMNARISFCTL